jgi:CBS domain containing-hemolysin-like protein
MGMTVWIELILFVVLLVFSGFFSSSETSLFSLSRTQLEQMRRDGNPHVNLIERLLSQPRRLIVTILIGNEFVNVAASVISAALVIELLGAENKLVNLFIMVPILLLVGEITPKTLAIRNNVTFASFLSRPIELFANLITPVRQSVRFVADWVTTLIVGRERSRANIVTEDMVRTLAKEAVGEGVLDPLEAQYINHIFDFGNKSVAQVMTPRSNIFFLPADMTLPEMVRQLHRTRRTKIPVYSGNRDNILGILYARDLLGLDTAAIAATPGGLQRVLRAPYYVPETKLAADLFHLFRKRRLSLALTVDEYGGVTGLVTMEDLLECIFGDLPSASDVAAGMEYRKFTDGSTRIAGSMRVEQFNREFDANLPEDGAETVGGLVLERLGELPSVGASLVMEGLKFSVATVRDNRIQELSVSAVSGAAEPRPGPEQPGPASSVGGKDRE